MAMKKKSGQKPAAAKSKSKPSAAKKPAKKAAPKKKPMAKKSMPRKAAKPAAKRAAKRAARPAAKRAAKPAKRPAAKAAPKKAAPKAKSAPKPKPAPKKPGLFSFRGVAVSITANDLAKSMAFYTDVLGFEITQRWEMEGVLRGAEMTSGDAVVMVGQDDWAKGTDRKKGQGMRLYLTAERSLDEVLAGLTARGLMLDGEVTDAAWGRYFSFADPDDIKYTILEEKAM